MKNFKNFYYLDSNIGEQERKQEKNLITFNRAKSVAVWVAKFVKVFQKKYKK